MEPQGSDSPHLIVRQAFDTAELVAQHPPRFTHRHKQMVWGLVSAGAPARGALYYSRWRPIPIPELVPSQPIGFVVREDVFTYGPPVDGVFEWTLNFADPRLFGAYAGQLLAQDELQVLEHPALGSLREALCASNDPRLKALTVEDGANTPVLVRGVERRCALATDPDLLEGRPLGLYGNQFARANETAIRRALRIIQPPTISNILAMAAPVGGTGRYTEQDLADILSTAFTGFRAAKLEAEVAHRGARVVVNTGHWGTGAFGGNRIVMALLQLLAARLAGIEQLVYHTVDKAGTEPCYAAERLLGELVAREISPQVKAILSRIHAQGFEWGISDGN